MRASCHGTARPFTASSLFWRWLLALALLLVVAACGGAGDSAPATAPPATPTGAVSGTVVVAGSGVALAGVTVSAAGRTGSTGADGRYTLADVPIGPAQAVSFTLAGHAKGVLAVAVTEGSTARADARLTPVAATQRFDAAAGATITVSGSPARVVLPAAGLVTASGAAASGTVTVEVTPIDPASNAANMPGNYTAQAPGGATTTIESFGALGVTLADATGAALNLAPGKTATLRIALATRSTSPPATIPLYYLNENTGVWVQEGTATLAGTAPNQYYEGTVSHFSYWNADQQTDTIRVIGCLQDGAGARVAGADVQSFGVDYSGRATVLSNATGDFAVPIRKGGVATVVAQLGDRSSNAVRVGPSQVDIVLPACLVLSAGGVAPIIVEQPQSMTAQDGFYAYFRAEAIGSPVLRYQWKRNGVVIAGQTAEAITLSPVSAADNGASYTVTVTNAYGSATSDAAVLSVNTTPLPPLIVGQPLPTAVLVGATATFEVSAVSQGGTLSYQWRRNGSAIAGATGTSYTTPATTLADNGSSFNVVVTSSNGLSATSNSVTLSVSAVTPLAITAQPQGVSVNVGQSAGFSVGASGGSAAIGYQWRRNGSAIAGATAASYTTPPTTLADSGSVYAVVVTSGSESLTSSNATLTVTPATGGNGYYLLASAGPEVMATVSFANGDQTVPTQAVVAVRDSAPASGAVTIEPAGQTRFFYSSAVEGSVSAGQVTNLRSRIGSYFKGGRLYKVDQLVASGTAPAPQLVSTLASNQVCGTGGFPDTPIDARGSDFMTPTHTWLFMRAPGSDALCNTADDSWRAVRLDMAATDVPRTLAGEPQVDVLGADASFGGVIIRDGVQMRQSNADLTSLGAPLFSIDAASYANLGHVYGSSLPGYWLFIDSGKLWGVNLAAPGTRVELATLAAGETNTPALASDGATAFVGLSGPSGSRVLRVTESLAPATTVTTTSDRITTMALTPTRLVLLTQGTTTRLLSVPKSGGTTTPLSDYGSGVIAGQMLASGENVYAARYQIGAGGALVSTLVIGADGSNPQTLANTDVKRGIAAASLPINGNFTNVYAVVLAGGVTSLASNAGATLRAVNGATRATLVTYGDLPATPDGIAYGITGDPLQYGLGGLFTYTDASSGSSDLYWFKSDATGLVRATSFLSATSATPASTREQARAVRAAMRAAAVGTTSARSAAWAR